MSVLSSAVGASSLGLETQLFGDARLPPLIACPYAQDMYTEVPVPAALKDYKSFEFLRRDLRVSPPSGAGAEHP